MTREKKSVFNAETQRAQRKTEEEDRRGKKKIG
jgi:hypothetical protein